PAASAGRREERRGGALRSWRGRPRPPGNCGADLTECCMFTLSPDSPSLPCPSVLLPLFNGRAEAEDTGMSRIRHSDPLLNGIHSCDHSVDPASGATRVGAEGIRSGNGTAPAPRGHLRGIAERPRRNLWTLAFSVWHEHVTMHVHSHEAKGPTSPQWRNVFRKE